MDFRGYVHAVHLLSFLGGVLQMPRIRATSELLIGTVLLAGLALPTLDSIARLDPAPAPQEKRALATWPGMPYSVAALLEFPGLVDSFVADHFGFRNALLRLHNYLTACLLGVSPSPSVEVMIGRDGWFYYTGENTLAYVEGRNLLSDTEVAAWRLALRQRSEWLAKQGIRYLVVLAPGKPSIYPEHLPRWVRPSRKETRADQIMAAVRGCSDVDVLDLRPTMLEAKRRARLYQPTDTHWNAIGAYAAYHAIMSRLMRWFPAARPMPFSSFDLEWGNDPGGDLAVMLDVQGLVCEARPWMAPKQPSRVRTLPIRDYASRSVWHRGQEPIVTERPGADIPRVVVLRDSFAVALVPFLSEHFGRAVYLWTAELDPRVIAREHPDLVIQEYAERWFSVLDPENPAAIAAVQPAEPQPE
jgi:alginate O-acetyltransferase complex protein AlgJ